MGKKMITLLVDEELLASIDKAAEAALDGKKRGRTDYILAAVEAAMGRTPRPEDKRLAGIIAAYESVNAKGRRYIATSAALAAEHADFAG